MVLIKILNFIKVLILIKIILKYYNFNLKFFYFKFITVQNPTPVNGLNILKWKGNII